MRRASPADPAASAAARGVATAGKLAVEEHGHFELLADPVGEDERLGAGGAAGGLVEIDDGRHVERADMWMLAARLRAA